MASFSSSQIFMVGVKGSGMSSLAIYLRSIGSTVSGWDVSEVFATDSDLVRNSIPFSHIFPSSEFLSSVDYLIYSSAYQKSHPIINAALEMGVPIYSYYEALAHLTLSSPTYGVSGTHGKTTSVATVSHIFNYQKIPHAVICGSSVKKYDEKIHYKSEADPLIVEACEYQDHFLLLSLKGLFITNVEYEHVDYFKSEEDLFVSFFQLINKVPPSSFIICNRDEKGMSNIINYVEQYQKDLTLITYGKSRDNDITYSYPYKSDIHSLYVKELDKEYTAQLVGEKLVSDLIGSALFAMMITKNKINLDILDDFLSTLHSFNGAKGRVQRRSPDSHPFYLYNDYAHHPSEVRSSLQSIRLLHPKQRIILLYFPHTVSRMNAFFEEFVSSFSLCNSLIIFPVALSARGDGTEKEAKEISRRLSHRCHGFYVENIDEAMNILILVLQRKDVCITMGAGNTHAIIDLLLAIKELPL